MKRLIGLICFGLLFCGGGYGQDARTFTITGDLSLLKNQWGNIDGDSLTMIFYEGYEQTDTIEFVDYQFQYTGEVASRYVTQAYLMVNGPTEGEEQIMILPVFVEPGEITVRVRELPEEEMFNIEVTGTKHNDLWSERIGRYVDLNYEMVDVSRDSTYTNEERMDIIYEMMQQQDSLIRNLYRDNRDTEIAPSLAIQRYYYGNDYMELGAEIEYLRERFSEHPDFHSMETTFWMMPGVSVGDKLPEVNTLVDRQGVGFPLSPEGIGDRYMLIYFWSSVSGPSMADFRALKRFPATYEGKELIRVGISTDKSAAVWHRSLRRHKPPGIQLWDEGLETSRQFHVTTYPVHFLIDPEGKVIAKGGFTTLDGIGESEEGEGISGSEEIKESEPEWELLPEE